jgi:predicted PurR-regulated permease PerM
LNAVGNTLKWWIIGQLTTMTIITVVTWAGLTLIGMSSPLAAAITVAVRMLYVKEVEDRTTG